MSCEPLVPVRSQSFELLSPCFCAGSDKKLPEMRVASIRGQLRWWHRVLCGVGKPEYEVFGGASGKRFRFSDDPVASHYRFAVMASQRNAEPVDQCIVAHKNPTSKALPPGGNYTLQWLPQAHPHFEWSEDEDYGKQSTGEALERTLRAWLLLGTIGRRATRAMGSVWPAGYCPTEKEFREAVSGLKFPSSVRWDVLSYDATDGGTVEKLLKAASLTVHGLSKDQFTGNPLGYVQGRNRKTSPLRFKIGRFLNADGGEELRLIAIWDDRDNRGGIHSRANLLTALCPALRRWIGGSSLATDANPGENLADTGNEGGDPDEIGHVLEAAFQFHDLQRNGRFHQAIERWQRDGRGDLIQQFLLATEEGKFDGLRNQAWYKELVDHC